MLMDQLLPNCFPEKKRFFSEQPEGKGLTERSIQKEKELIRCV